MSNVSDSITWSGLAALLIKDVVRAVMYRNGSSRRVTAEHVRAIVKEEIAPMREDMNNISERVDKIIFSQRASASGD